LPPKKLHYRTSPNFGGIQTTTIKESLNATRLISKLPPARGFPQETFDLIIGDVLPLL
jgi:hypothetical protein